MASVFLSYARDDVAKARSVALALEKAGHSVWWDRHIKGGAQYSKEIEAALKAADAVVVLWSEQSVDSAWVRDEAAAGRDSGRLVPVKLDQTEPPLGFRQYQTIDLSGWRGRGKPPTLETLLEAVESISGAPAQSPVGGVTPASRASPMRMRLGLIVAAIALVTLAALTFWRPWQTNKNVPVVAVGPANPNPAASALARDLLVKLGSLRSAKAGSLRLVEYRREGSKAADLLIQADANGDARQGQVTLALLDGRDQTLLWSKEFQPPQGNAADLEQQLAYTAARVLDCAVEGINAGGRRLDQQTLTLYLNGCAQHAELIGSDPTEVVPIYLQVTDRAPWFKPAWAKLLSAETAIGSPSGSAEIKAMAARVRAHIAQARKLDPTMAEAVLAEGTLLPKTALIEKVRLIDRAILKQPDNPNLLAARSSLRGLVGRWNDAIRDARRASELEPLSPAFRHAYILALAYGGQAETAFKELAKAERLWPGASNMTDARFRLHFRYGDPKEALRLLRTGLANAPPSSEVILIAKTNPNAENVERAKTLIRNAVQRYPNMATGPLQAYADFGIENELHEVFSRWGRFEPGTLSVLFRPAFRNFQKDPRFMQLAARSGLIVYWRETGQWPDFCFDPDLPYDCKVEAAKIAAK